MRPTRRPRPLLAACLEAGACSGLAAPPGAEAGVYAAVLEAGHPDDRGVPRRLVVARETDPAIRPGDGVTAEGLAYHRRHLPGLQPATELAFRRAAREVRPLPAALPTRRPVAWISASELSGVLAAPPGPGEWWSRWRLRGSGGASVFSPIGFNADSTQALVYHRNACPGLCSYGEYVLAARRGGRWVVAARVLDWIS